MYASIPTLLAEGNNRQQIAKLFGVTHNSLAVKAGSSSERFVPI